ncbi:hypothetical protein R3I94_017773 [Phoxinus phoxinus]|uniref:Uncharacterized protein n=1 Tax=Phoxinus phoxinus TaxID=58324 RepID=A0AAN9CK98_9TELE
MHKHKAIGQLCHQSNTPANGRLRDTALRPITAHVALQWAEPRPSAAVTLSSLSNPENGQNREENSEKRARNEPEQEH